MLMLPFGDLTLTVWTLILIVYGRGENMTLVRVLMFIYGASMDHSKRTQILSGSKYGSKHLILVFNLE